MPPDLPAEAELDLLCLAIPLAALAAIILVMWAVGRRTNAEPPEEPTTRPPTTAPDDASGATDLSCLYGHRHARRDE
jgi:hypothetical protein